MAPRVSLCLIVKNEETTLPACLASTADLVDEIILVDTGSTDRTKEVAATFQARIVEFDWVQSFSAARNECLRHARGDWIFYLDADEYLDEANREKLQSLFGSLGSENRAYVMQVRSRPAKDRATPVVVDQVRLFRQHSEHRWQYRVHEQILPALQATGAAMQWTDIVIEHSGYEDASRCRAKLERNLRLLHQDDADHPDKAFLLCYLGWTYLDLGQAAEALPFLRRSQDRAEPTAGILPLLYACQVYCLQELGQPQEALALCQAGRARFPADVNLVFQEALLRQQCGDPRGAETCLRQLLEVRPGADPGTPPLRSVRLGVRGFLCRSEGLPGYLARHHLALLLREQGRLAEAETEWRVVLEQQPSFGPAVLELGEIFLTQARWAELEQAAALLAQDRPISVEAALLRARGCLARQEFVTAQQILEEILAHHPDEVWPRVVLTHVFLQQGQEEAAEKVLRDVLQRDPTQLESWCNLAKLLRNQGRLMETAAVCREARKSFPDALDLLRLHGTVLHDLNDLAAAEACLLRVCELQSAKEALGADERQSVALARHTLAQIYAKQERLAEAEAQWLRLLEERLDFSAG